MTKLPAGITLLASLLLLAPFVAAEQGTPAEDPERPDDAAWNEECPPDMMCAAGGGDNATRGPEDCEFCRYNDTDDGCIDCAGMPTDPPGDGAGGEIPCDPEVQCMYDGEPVLPAGDGPAEPEEAPALAPVLIVVGLAVLALLVGLRND